MQSDGAQTGGIWGRLCLSLEKGWKRKTDSNTPCPHVHKKISVVQMEGHCGCPAVSKDQELERGLTGIINIQSFPR